MKSVVRVVSLILFSLTVFSISVYAEEKHGHETKKESNGVESLSPELRKLLSKEMVALQSGMMAVIPAYVSGHWSEIEAIGHKMKGSYILKQSLSEEQMHELHSKLPQDFIKLDQRFHYLAGMLSHAAQNKKPELVGFYFAELSESCLACHSQFATHKFPELAHKKGADDHSH